MPSNEALVFDVYGTLVDPIGIARHLEGRLPPADAADVARIWRHKQLDISFRLTAMGRYEDFAWCTRKALDHALALLDKKLEPSEKESLIARYNDLEPFPDAVPALSGLLDRGHVLAVLSNGTPAMLEAILDASRLRPYFTEIISVDEVRAFKPSPLPYRHAAMRLNLPPSRLRLVSSNSFDIIGAESAGLRAAWVDRSGGVFEPDGGPPDIVIRSLTDLPAALDSTPGHDR
ncbi:haloacid dehalogenase type II [Actinomadura sp. KC216]|uniref:haloacid dehalogenase type II n=1 Tax=Actinomadura sp. KC216 TaxID=2530370 RepID=UPI00104E5754|nr:haloacid dehalogenase type II [Actinomadura sp. KC216]TDB74235.1 haloacid dehalogenase type II [Actinomadura sp. KC216]